MVVVVVMFIPVTRGVPPTKADKALASSATIWHRENPNFTNATKNNLPKHAKEDAKKVTKGGT